MCYPSLIYKLLTSDISKADANTMHLFNPYLLMGTRRCDCRFEPHSKGGNMSSIFSGDSEASASELPENLEEMYIFLTNNLLN